MRISRHYSDYHVTQDIFETRLAVYEDQIRGWFHDQARILEKASDHAGFVLLLIAVSYIESYAVFWKGEDSRNRSREFFREAFKDILPIEATDPAILDNAIDDLYHQVRCGLFHVGITRAKVTLAGRFNDPVGIEVNNETREVVRININPHSFLDTIEEHFSTYVMRLRDPSEEELRGNFDRAWNLRLE
jgi:hypothetical protein